LQHQATIYISLGSNIDAHYHLDLAHRKLLDTLSDAEISPIYRSPAVGMDGPDFLNAVIRGKTSESVHSVVKTLRRLESESGRVRSTNKFVDRTLDLDLLLFGDLVCAPGDDDFSGNFPVTLPNPEVLEEAYVLQPLADLAGELVHPTTGTKISEICEHLKKSSPGKFDSLQQINLRPR